MIFINYNLNKFFIGRVGPRAMIIYIVAPEWGQQLDEVCAWCFYTEKVLYLPYILAGARTYILGYCVRVLL